MNEIETLKKQVEELKRRLDNLDNSYAIPLSIQKAFEGRDFLTTKDSAPPPSGAEVAGMGFIQEITISGTPQTISVPEFPTQFLEVKSKKYAGTTIYIPVFYL